MRNSEYEQYQKVKSCGEREALVSRIIRRIIRRVNGLRGDILSIFYHG